MTDRKVTVKLAADTADYTEAMDEATRATHGLTEALDRVRREIQKLAGVDDGLKINVSSTFDVRTQEEFDRFQETAKRIR